MKMIRKIATVALGLACLGSTVFAQSLADAKKAIDAEQYQKAKAMLKNLTVTQAKDDETFFQLGWVYILQDYIDSAKTVFNQAIQAHPKSALNYVGLGVAARLSKDNAGATSNFNTAMGFTGKKDSKPWLYMGKGYLQLLPNTKAVTTADADAAIAALSKGKLANPKDAEVALELGNAYRSKRDTGPAYDNYNAASELDPKSPAVKVAQGVLISNAHNFEGAIEEYKKALAIDPNYGPAYREWAETDKNWSFENRAVAVEKINEGVEQYKKYLSLTDESDETLMRYADFLISAGKWKELQEVSAKLAKSAGSNIRALRYLGYAGYENKDYEKGMKALRDWFAKAGPNRILPRDYFYKGRLEVAAAKDTVAGVESLKKAAELYITLVESAYSDIIALRKAQKNYFETAKAYEELINKMGAKAPIANHIYKGIYSYFAFNPKSPDSTLLIKADSAFSFANRKLTKPSLDALVYRARIAELRDNREDLNKMVGYAKPFYEKFIEVMTAEPSTDPRMIKNLGEAYAYMGNYYLYHDKDDAKAMEMYTKALEKDPTNRQAKFYFDNKSKAATPAPAPKKPTK
jgi:tetratricopeptide (TPR) repeat protein